MPGLLLCLVLVVSPLLPAVASINCYSSPASSSATFCSPPDSTDSRRRVVLPLGLVLVGHILNGLLRPPNAEEDPLTKFVDYLKQQLNTDVSQAVVKSTLQLLEHDVSDNCYITYDTSTRTLEDRGCGGGPDFVQYMKENPYNFWTTSFCFPRPGFPSHQVCLCHENGCNLDDKTARTAANIATNSRWVECGGRQCPLADLSRLSAGLGAIDTACYTSPGSSSEQCFTTEGIFSPVALAGALYTSSWSSGPADLESGYNFSKINGAGPACFMCNFLSNIQQSKPSTNTNTNTNSVSTVDQILNNLNPNANINTNTNTNTNTNVNNNENSNTNTNMNTNLNAAPLKSCCFHFSTWINWLLLTVFYVM